MHMRTIAISINKGGQGKTALVKMLATAATQAGLNVLVLDLDTQQNSVGWRKRRDKQQTSPLPVVKFSTEKGLADDLNHAAKAGCDLVLIDTPPGRSSEAMAGVEAAEMVIIPFWNDQDSYEGVATTAVMARRIGTPAMGVLNFVTPNSKSHEETARKILEAIGLPMSPVILTRYDVHRVANVKGLTAQELEPNGSAAGEIAALWNWFSSVVQLGETAHVHKGAA